MSRDVKELIATLEAERDELVALHDELDQEVHNGEVTQQLADQILWRACNGQSYRSALEHKNVLLKEAHSIIHDQRRELAIAVSPGLLVILVGLTLIWSFGGITGLFTLSDETFYRIPIDLSTSNNALIDLPIEGSISSVRLNGEVSGVGTANVWLSDGDRKLLIAHFDSTQEPPSALTGLFTADIPDVIILAPTDDTIVTVVEENTSNITTIADAETPSDAAIEDDLENSIADQNNEIPTETTPSEASSLQNNTTQNQSEVEITTDETILDQEEANNSSDNYSTGESEIPTAPIILPTTPSETTSEDELDVKADELRSEEWDAQCLQTCILSGLQSPYRVEIEISGDVSVTIDNLVYGVPRKDDTNNTTNTETPPIPTLENETNASSEGNNTGNFSGLDGQNCTTDVDCAGSVCVSSVYQGSISGGICSNNRLVCNANNVLYDVGAVLADSTCKAANNEAGWIVNSGQGRFDIRNGSNETVSVIDKYGMFAISGKSTFSTTPINEGWLLKDANNTTVLSVDYNGNLLTSGTLSERTIPTKSTTGEFIIQDTQGNIRAVLRQTGDVILNGELLEGANLNE